MFKDRIDVEYFRTRDSVTGQRNLTFAVREFNNLKDASFGAVLVRAVAEELSEETLSEIAFVLAAAQTSEVCRVSREEFVIFCKEWDLLADKLFYVLARLPFEGVSFAVSCDKIDGKGDFHSFLKILRRGAAAAEINAFGCAVH